MNEVVFTDLPFTPKGCFFTNRLEFIEGKPKIHIVEDFNCLRELFRQYHLAPWIPNREQYDSYDVFVEDVVEGSITHETLHWVIFKLEGMEAQGKLNNLDQFPDLYNSLR